MLNLRVTDDGGREIVFDTPWGAGRVVFAPGTGDGNALRLLDVNGRAAGTARIEMRTPSTPADIALAEQTARMGKGCCGD